MKLIKWKSPIKSKGNASISNLVRCHISKGVYKVQEWKRDDDFLFCFRQASLRSTLQHIHWRKACLPLTSFVCQISNQSSSRKRNGQPTAWNRGIVGELSVLLANSDCPSVTKGSEDGSRHHPFGPILLVSLYPFYGSRSENQGTCLALRLLGLFILTDCWQNTLQ